ncbi:hypothetical protein [Variovorax guangxiensis]|uniref:Uncharacterized protein n=1 Tax=Variovorax guangxiensis TaxID=1775474 RepID=A0A840G8Q3_9BURK|nr:hypothetical protein [Variovorax guangxiensis]MBB4225611.1 hypothetical protein [Variovorax guangxiensis]
MDPQLQRHLDQMVRQAQHQAGQELVVLFIIGAISTLITLWLLYWVIRVAVRDGFMDANRDMRSTRRSPELRDGLKEKISTPDMRAD